jgi:hypothetical protein
MAIKKIHNQARCVSQFSKPQELKPFVLNLVPVARNGFSQVVWVPQPADLIRMEAAGGLFFKNSLHACLANHYTVALYVWRINRLPM